MNDHSLNEGSFLAFFWIYNNTSITKITAFILATYCCPSLCKKAAFFPFTYLYLFFQVSVSTSHIVALTSDLLVFTWGDGRRGQLGHGELETWRSRPEAVESLKTKSITKVGAGDGFSVFASDNGIVMTCGDGTLGCLGKCQLRFP